MIRKNFESDRVIDNLYTKEQVGEVVTPIFIRDAIEEDLASRRKKEMRAGVSYYNEEHEILKAKADVIEVDGQPVKIPNASNFKVVHNFHTLLVDQKKDYMMGGGITFTFEDSISEKQQEAIEAKLTPDFDENMQKTVLGASNKAEEWIHYFIDENGQYDYAIIPAEQIIPFYDGRLDRVLTMVIRYYRVEITNVTTGKKESVNAVEVWEPDKVTYYIQTPGGNYILDPNEPINPRPHAIVGEVDFTEERNLNEDEVFSWQSVPFLPLYNNSARKTDLRPIKSLIDLYDQLISTGANTIIDVQEAIWEVRGAEGEKIGELAKKLRTYKTVATSDESGSGIKGHQLDIPWDARKDLIEKTKEAIYEQGRGVDMSSDKFGNSPSGIALKFLYSGLDIKCNALEISLNTLIRKLVYSIVYYLNFTKNWDINPKDISWKINRSTLANDAEQAQIAQGSKGVISDKTIVENHPWTKKNPEREMNRIEEEAEQRASMGDFEIDMDQN